MTEIRFYHLTRTPLEKALPKLLEKMIEQGKKILVVGESEPYIETLNTLLWTYHPSSFLPHGTRKDGFLSYQPIFLAPDFENANGASFCVTLDGRIPSDFSQWESIFDLFQGEDIETIQKAKKRWNTYDSYLRFFFLQDDTGKWQKTETFPL